MSKAFTDALIVANFVAFVLLTMPLPFHLKAAWNIGACIIMVWLGLTSLSAAVNGIAWRGNVDIRAPVWCDIFIKLSVGSAFALPAAVLAINRRLFIISKDPCGALAAQRRMIVEDLAIGFLLPLVLTLLTFIPQGHRANILEDVGCRIPYYNTIPAIILQPLPTLLLGLVSAVYGGLNIYSFHRRQKALRSFLSPGSSTLLFTQYLRLTCLGTVDTLITVPLAAYILYSNIAQSGPIQPWVWSSVKADYGMIWQYPRSAWDSPSVPSNVAFKISLWFNILCAAFFFGFFGCSRGVVNWYKGALAWVLVRLRIRTQDHTPPSRPQTYVDPIRFVSRPKSFEPAASEAPAKDEQLPKIRASQALTTSFGSISMSSLHDVDVERGDPDGENHDAANGFALHPTSSHTRISTDGSKTDGGQEKES